MREEMIKRFEEAGAKRWTKGRYDRLYINAGALGYTWERYNTGNIKNAWLNGEMISNGEMRRVMGAKTYIDVETGKVSSNYDEEAYKEAVENFIKSVEEEAEEAEEEASESEDKEDEEEKEMKFEEMSTEEIKEAVEESWEALSEEDRREIEARWADVIENTDGAREQSAPEAVADFISDWGYVYAGKLSAYDFRNILLN